VALLPNILQFQRAREDGCNEVIFKRYGLFTECAHSNIFFVMNNVLFTHPESDHILSGISRKNIIALARNCHINIKEEPFPCIDLANCSEVFITNTSFEIAPVINIDGNLVADGKPGRITLLLREKFDEMIGSMKR
jgi:D-alanine transaminase